VSQRSVVLGSLLAFGASFVLQRLERRAAARSHIYLELLPQLRLRAIRYHRVADQDPGFGPWATLKDDDWASESDMDTIYRYAVLAGGPDVHHVEEIRRRWLDLCKSFDEEMMLDPTQLILGNAAASRSAAATLRTIDRYSSWIQARNLRRPWPWGKRK